jgi:hypothetical protein
LSLFDWRRCAEQIDTIDQRFVPLHDGAVG